MIVISDTSSLYYASRIGCDVLLPQVFGRVIIPKAVYEELVAVKSEPYVDALLKAEWLAVLPVNKSPLLASLFLNIDPGESEAIALAVELSADYVLIDERRGAKVARNLRLQTVGLLGVFILAKQKAIISEVKPLIDRLTSQAKFRYSKKLIDSVLKLANEL